MSDDPLKCPECGSRVPQTGLSTGYGIDVGGGEVSWQAEREHARCPSCRAKLWRPKNLPDARWQLERG